MSTFGKKLAWDIWLNPVTCYSDINQAGTKRVYMCLERRCFEIKSTLRYCISHTQVTAQGATECTVDFS